MQVRPAEFFDYKPRQPVPFKHARNPLRELQEENPLSSQVFEIAHVGTDILLDHALTGPAALAGGVAALAVGTVAAGWGVARLRSEAWPDKVDAIGHLALAGSSALSVAEQLAGLHVPGHAALEVVHGLATLGLGLSELHRARREGPLERKLVGASEVALGLAITGGALLGHLAPALHLVAVGALAVKEGALNRDRLLPPLEQRREHHQRQQG